ncbi:AAA-like domain-containing protein [Pantanalinema rosaneae CENA516]|uniref:AAA-like domain-containing protein n=1 Tax=Pantanalinema rosaneae TaxID=1620701 RepID=UPI003D6F9799
MRDPSSTTEGLKGKIMYTAASLRNLSLLWDLNRIYLTLAEAKKKPLTTAEKEYVQGLLSYKRPQEIAKDRGVEVRGARVELSKLYQLARIGLQQEKVTCSNFAELFKAAGYALQANLETPERLTKVKDHEPVFLSYCEADGTTALAEGVIEFLDTNGYPVLADVYPTQLDPLYVQVIAEDLKQSNYLIFLLSSSMAISEQALELIRYVRELWDERGEKVPAILSVRINWTNDTPITYELQQFLNEVPQLDWQDGKFDKAFCQGILTWIESKSLPDTPESPNVQTLGSQSGLVQYLPPLPKASPVIVNELPTGQVALHSSLYVNRSPIEENCYSTVLQPGALIRIKAPRQMGKTSLMARILHHATNHTHYAVGLSFQLAERNLFVTFDRFLKWICSYVSQSLNLPNRINEDWNADLYGSSVSCSNYFKKYVLQQLDQPLVLALDELDRVFEYDHLAEDFLALLRAWYEQGRRDETWAKFKLIMVHATDVYVPMNVYQSPFNVGLPIDLPEFTLEQMHDLAGRYQLQLTTDNIQQLRYLISGHPYLVQVAFYALAYRGLSLEYLYKTAVTESGVYSDHLRRYLWQLNSQPELIEAIKQIVKADRPVRVDPSVGFKLQALGLVNPVGNEVVPRCHLYRQYFGEWFAAALDP